MSQYYDSYSRPEPGWMRLLRALQATFRLGHFFQVEVRVFWITVVLTPLILLSEYARVGFSGGELWFLAATYFVFLYLIVYTHEMGHIAAGWRYRIHTPLITLSPLGGLAHMASGAPNPRADMIISVAGPAVHLVWLALVAPFHFGWIGYGDSIPAGWYLSPLEHAVTFLWHVNLWLMLFNLLPFWPMDGGRILRAFLAQRTHPNRATRIAARIGQVGAIGFFLYGIFGAGTWGWILILIGITNFFACMQEIKMARYAAGPYQGLQLAAWETDPEAWKRTHAASTRPPRTGPIARWRERRRQRAMDRADEDRATLEADVDRVLARVSEVGMAGLTARERKILLKASKVRRSDGSG